MAGGLLPSLQRWGGWRVGVRSAQGPEPFACAVLLNGALHRNDVTGKRMAARAQADVMRFNVPTAGC